MPTLPSVPTSWLKRRQAGRCGCGQTAPAPRATASTAAPPVLASRGKLSAEETLFGVLVELLEHRRHCAYCRDPLVEGEQAVYTHPHQKDNKGCIHLGGEPSGIMRVTRRSSSFSRSRGSLVTSPDHTRGPGVLKYSAKK